MSLWDIIVAVFLQGRFAETSKTLLPSLRSSLEYNSRKTHSKQQKQV